jgi:16S rRNA (cytosine1402-N4)-methyltransferase
MQKRLWAFFIFHFSFFFSVHQSVLYNEILELLRPVGAGGILVDATVGLAGHSEGLLERYPEARLIGIDRDPQALELAAERLKRFGARATLVRGRHEAFIEILKQQGVEEVDGVLADLGVSSMQLDRPERGFSFRFDAPLDMRMSGEGPTAADLVNELDQDDLARILREYGEEPMARRIARAIVEGRAEGRIETTAELAAIVKRVKGGSARGRRPTIDPSTLTFQALRIATNEELIGLEGFLEDAVSKLRPGGRIAVISFHSLEDRIVKRLFRRLEGECVCPPGLPVCGCGSQEVVKLITRKPIEAGDEEVAANPRSRSARLRVAEKI